MNSLTEKIQTILKDAFPEGEVYVGPMRGASDDHLEIQVTSQKFHGLGLLEQHQSVMDVLKKDLSQELHAVKIKTKIP